MVKNKIIQLNIRSAKIGAIPDINIRIKSIANGNFSKASYSYDPSNSTYLLEDLVEGKYILQISYEDHETLEKEIYISENGYSDQILLGEKGVRYITQGKQKIPVLQDDSIIGIELLSPSEENSKKINSLLKELELEKYHKGGHLNKIWVLHSKKKLNGEQIKKIKKNLKKHSSIAKVGPIIQPAKDFRPVFLSGFIFIKLKDKNISDGEINKIIKHFPLKYHVRDFYFPEIVTLLYEDVLGFGILDLCEELIKCNDVFSAEAGLITTIDPLQIFPNDLLRCRQWHLDVLRLPQAWERLQLLNANLKFGNADIILGIHDSGIETIAGVPQHSEFIGNVVGGNLTGLIGNNNKLYFVYDYTTNGTAGDPMQPDNDTSVRTHGTKVSAVALALSDDVNGVVGIAPNVRFMSMQFTGQLVDAMKQAHALLFTTGLNPHWVPGAPYHAGQVFPIPFGNPGNIGPGADIVNMSHTAPVAPALIELNAFQLITAFSRKRRGSLLFMAAGNFDQNFRNSNKWGEDVHVMIVSGSTLDNKGRETRTPYSSFASVIDPGIDFCCSVDSVGPVTIHDPPLMYGVVTATRLGTGDVPGTRTTTALITNGPLAGTSNINLNAADVPNFPIDTIIVIRNVNAPKKCETVIVGAVAGNILTLKAPLENNYVIGDEICTGPLDYTEIFDGTSSACPMASGIASLIISAKPTLNWLEIREIMRSTAVPIKLKYLGFARRNRWIEIDANAAVNDLVLPNGLLDLRGPTVNPNFNNVAAGATLLNIGNTNGFSKRQSILIGAESRINTLAPLAQGFIKVDNTAGFILGPIIIGNNTETFISDNGDHPGLGPSSGTPGDSFIHVQNSDGFVIGERITIGVGGNAETVTIVSFPGAYYNNPANGHPVPAAGGESFTIQFAPALANMHNRGDKVVSADKENNTVTGIPDATTLNLLNPLAQAYPVNTIVQTQNTEIRVIKKILGPSIIEIDPLEFPQNGVTKVHGGRVATYSYAFGYGRLDAKESVDAAINYTHNERDLMIRNHLGDDGVNPVNPLVNPIISPDIWIRNSNDNFPFLNFNEDGPHQNPELDIKRAEYTGVGLNDMSTEGDYTDIAPATFEIEIDAVGNPDTFKWRKDNGAFINGVAITGVPQVLSDGVRITFNAITGHTLGDKWAVKTQISQRYIYVRVSNRGNMFSSFSSSIAGGAIPVTHLRFYLALSNGVNPFALTDYIFEQIPAFSLQSNVAGTKFIGEIPFNPLAQGANRIEKIAWPEEEIPPRNGPNGPPPLVPPLRLFILAEVVPHDGIQMGTLVGQNNNISYREIIFADFQFNQQGNQNLLPGSIQVDNFGNSLTTNFDIHIKSETLTFTTEKVTLQIIREDDNGLTTTAEFKFNGANWAFTGGNPGWTNINPPVIFGTVNNAAGEQFQITFSGNFSAAKQHDKVTLKAIINSSISGVSIAEEAYDILIIEQQIPPTGISPNPPEIKPRIHIFTDMAKLDQPQPAGKAFGPKPGDEMNKFRVTSTFTANNKALKAYAVTDGIVMVQKINGNVDQVNLILKPINQSGLDFTPVKYYIYRGLRLDNFLDNANPPISYFKVTEIPNVSDFITRITNIHKAQNPLGTDFLSKAIGYDPNNALQAPAKKIDQYFFKPDPDIQLALVPKGEWIGNFFTANNAEFGFEIILEEGSFQPDFTFAREPFHEVDVTGLLSGTNAEKFSLALKREEILNFVDPAAFYGMHFDGTVDMPTQSIHGQVIVADIVSKFATKDKIYLDIRSENGDSYNFYRNYKGPAIAPANELGRQLKIGTVAGNLTPEFYKTDEWPIIIKNFLININNPENDLFIALRVDDNLKPILYSEHGKIATPSFNFKFVEGNNLIPSPQPDWTNEIGFKYPNTGTGANKPSIAWVIKLHYGRQVDASTVWPPEVLQTNNYYDNVFGPVDINELWDSPDEIQWLNIQDKKYIDGLVQNFGYMAERGTAFDENGDGRVILYSAASDKFKNAEVPSANGVTSGTSKKGSFFEVAMVFGGYTLNFDQIVENSVSITTLNLTPKADFVAPESDMMVLGISKAEFTALKNLAGLSSSYQRYILLKEVGVGPIVDGNGKAYWKFELGLQGLDIDGKYLSVFPMIGSEIFVYTLDRLFFTSDTFSKDEPFPTTYSRNYEEEIGIKNKPLIIADISDVSDVNTGTKTFIVSNKREGLDYDYSFDFTKGDTINVSGSSGNNGVYTVVQVTLNGNKTEIKVQENIPGNADPKGKINIKAKPYEDYFIDLDQAGNIGATVEMKTLVANFIAAISGVLNDDNAKAALTNLIDQHAPLILDRAREFVNHDNHSNPDDRILYWARIKMVVALKSHSYLLQSFTDRSALVKIFDSKSRGYDSVNFGPAPGGAKKILISGYDPFFLNPDKGDNPFQNNSSGIAALYLHGKTLVYNGFTGFIQSVVVPVRFRDFDNGIIDNLFDQFLSGPQVDMIITLSLQFEDVYNVERFAAKFRGKSGASNYDNEGVYGLTPKYYELNSQNTELIPVSNIDNLPEFTETTLPVVKIVPGTFGNGDFIAFNQAWETETDDRAESLPGESNASTLPNPPANEKSVAGSGSNYLSNEIFYRVSLLRDNRLSTVKTGHIHVPDVQKADKYFDRNRAHTLIDDIEKIIKDSITGL